MPGIPATHRACIGNFHRILYRQPEDQVRGRGENQQLYAASDNDTAINVDAVSEALADVRNRSQPRSSCSISRVISDHPVAATLIGITTVLAVTGVVAGNIYNSSSHDTSALSPQWPDVPLSPQPLIMPDCSSPTNGETVIGVCQGVIEKFSQQSAVSAEQFPLDTLGSIKSDTEKMECLAHSMVQDAAVDSEQLMRAGQCSGVDLRKNTVQVMISNLEEKRSALLANGSISTDMAINVIAIHAEVQAIDRRIAALRDISGDLYDATVTINRKILGDIG